ncbi:hypothetical protein QMY03_09275 [Arthrobacter sp. KFRI-F3372]|uniref:hypothetical protein n=1 Tax=Arthrobacter oryzae TaxID=409290 RepID=UPI0027889A9A|nr:hypothetical protein [Arthrobacter oryzae]MDP9989005.1 hypothetical protein [Arthrobacter oryzae]WHP61072.1 hypothetical protein QMY03_09275 [Arthrobacter sp. KFRI-F3372]
MPGPADVLGPILELMTWVGFVPGIPLLVTGWIMARRRCHWTSTTAEVFDAGRYKGLRWLDSANTPHLSLHALTVNSPLESGENIELHYDQCHPARWSLGPPRHDNTVLIVGWILTVLGILCTVAGFVLLML